MFYLKYNFVSTILNVFCFNKMTNHKCNEDVVFLLERGLSDLDFSDKENPNLEKIIPNALKKFTEEY